MLDPELGANSSLEVDPVGVAKPTTDTRLEKGENDGNAREP
jgi:hypothetical protein